MVPFEVKNDIDHGKTEFHALIDTRIPGEAMHTRERHIVLIVGLGVGAVARGICGVLGAARSASSGRGGGLADRVLKDTTISKRQLDLATRMMLERVSRLSGGDCGQSAMFQLFLDCVDRAIVSSTAFLSFRRQPMKFDDNRTLSLRVVDPIADEGVWAVIDDGCNSCCHGEVWRQNAEAKMKSFWPSP